MRSALLSLPILGFLTLYGASNTALANDGGTLVMPVATPWMDNTRLESKIEREIMPKKISLADLENLDSRSSYRNGQEQPKSTLESLYSDRIIDELEQYGYDLFDQNLTHPNISSIPAGTVQGDYILSAGDKLNIILRGQLSSRSNYEIDNQGLLVIPNFPPIPAAGRSLSAVTKDLKTEVQNHHNTQIFVSLSSVRQIGVLVVGHVIQPGRKNLTAFHTILDALNEAGGVQKDGSLRHIKLVRKGKSHFVDLYQLLMASGGGADKLLQDGDRVIVPPIGPTMAVSGSVKRPAIYEIRKGEKISLHQALSLGGGALTPGQNRYMKLEYTTNGEETVENIGAPKNRVFGDGTILMVAQSKQKRSSVVTLSGNTRQPGPHDIRKSKTLSGLISNEKILGQDIYPLIGVIERQDKKQLTKKLIEFSPFQVLHKKHDEELEEGDEVRLFSLKQIRDLETKDRNQNKLLHKASLTSKKDKDVITDPILRAFLSERAVFVRGSVRQAGAYPVVNGTTLENILAIVGGLSLEANKESIELTSREAGRRIINLNTDNPADIIISAGDTIRVNQKFHKIADQSVMLFGEVNHPGRYDLMPGDTLSKLIERAGGLTEQSYPDATIFSRASERKREEGRYKAQAQDLEMKLASALQQTDNDKKPDMGQVNATQNLITQLKNAQAVGRITVEADPAMLSTAPEQDILLEKGDKIFIPKRPLTVRVAGEVLSPAALQFRKGKDPLEYIREAGGTTYYADKDRAFVIHPDGSAQPLQVNVWNHRATFITPGATIIVPRDPKPFNFLEGAERVSQILANLAISGLYIDAINDDD
jgi:protein involved in polysaccharide export with SLBB domain